MFKFKYAKDGNIVIKIMKLEDYNTCINYY